MIVITLTDCPPALRGDLTKWLQEINTGVYVGYVSARVREELWKRVTDIGKSGRATMVFSTNTEQRYDFRVHNTIWEPIDFDGLKLMLRPSPSRMKRLNELQSGFSNAAKIQNGIKIRRAKSGSMPLERYIVVDLETTGLSPTEHEIIEIGAVLVNARIVENEFHSLIKTDANLSSEIKSLTGLSEDILKSEGRDLNLVITEFVNFAGDLPVIAHNASFDYAFIRSACERYGLPLFSNHYIDTLTFAKRLVDNVQNYKLQTLLKHFDIRVTNSHRSIADCLLVKQLYEKLIDIERRGE